MTDEEKLELLTNAINEVTGNFIDRAKLNKLTPVSAFDLDSLDVVEIQMYCEDRLGHPIQDSIDPIRTVGDLLLLLDTDA